MATFSCVFLAIYENIVADANKIQTNPYHFITILSGCHFLVLFWQFRRILLPMLTKYERIHTILLPHCRVATFLCFSQLWCPLLPRRVNYYNIMNYKKHVLKLKKIFPDFGHLYKCPILT